MTGHPYRCRTCQRGSPYVYCSNACYRASLAKKSKSACAVCRPKDGFSAGDTTRLCPACRKDPANETWVRTPRREYNGFDPDFFEAANGGLEVVESRPYRGVRAIRIVRMIAGGVRYREIADLLECSISYVDRVSKYWNKETGNLLRKIRKATLN